MVRRIVAIFAGLLLLGLYPAIGLEFSQHTNASAKLNAILASGLIREGDAAKLMHYLRHLSEKPNTAIYLSSPGGSLNEGMKLGRLFRQKRIKTVVEGGSMCASACALAFLAGRDRDGRPWMSSTTTSQLGFHAFRNGDGSTVDQTDRTLWVASEVVRYWGDIGAPVYMLEKMLATPSSKMYWFRDLELLSLGVKVWDMQNNCFVPCKN